MRYTFLWLVSAALGAPQLAAEPRITITLYDGVGLPREIREAMKSETSRILLQAGVQLEWVECEVDGKPVNLAECAQPLGTARLMLQLTQGRNKRAPRASGLAVIQDGTSVFACLYPEQVNELARDANWDFADLLGHAAAHELGHLLLRSNAHAPAGVMRARWETGDLRRISHAGLIFRPGQLRLVQAATSQHLPDGAGQLR